MASIAISLRCTSAYSKAKGSCFGGDMIFHACSPRATLYRASTIHTSTIWLQPLATLIWPQGPLVYGAFAPHATAQFGDASEDVVERCSLVVTRENPNPRRRKQATELPSARTPQPRKILRSLKLRACFQCSIYKFTGMRCYSEVVYFTLPSRCHLRPDGCALRFHRTALAGWGRDNHFCASGIDILRRKCYRKRASRDRKRQGFTSAKLKSGWAAEKLSSRRTLCGWFTRSVQVPPVQTAR
jgi:hypothetical protein